MAGAGRGPLGGDPEWERLGSQAHAIVPPGPIAAFADRVLVYARANQVTNVLPLISRKHGGIVIGKSRKQSCGQAVKEFRGESAGTPYLLDPAHYEHYIATPDQPFYLPSDRLEASTLDAECDEQLSAGASMAVTSTGLIPAGATDTLKVVLDDTAALGRSDVLPLLPLDISLLDQAYFDQTFAIITEAQLPVALVLVAQLDPLEHSKHIVPNLRRLAAAVPLLPVRTDLNALDLVAHGALCGAIGLSGATRHAVPVGEKPIFTKKNSSPKKPPHVLVTDLLSWWRNDRLVDLFGARQNIAPRCDCPVCGYRERLTRFVGREGDRTMAYRHDVAVWTSRAEDLLSAPTLRGRAEYWRNVCASALDVHQVFKDQLDRKEPIKPQDGLKAWATLPAWPTISSALP